MIKIENTSDKVELKETENDNVIEVWTKEDIRCFALMRTNYDTGISIICNDDDMVFLNMSYENDDIPNYYIEDDRFYNRSNKSVKIDIINRTCKLCIIPKNSKILELTRVTKYNINTKKYNNSMLNIGNILILSSLKDQTIEKFESSVNSDGTENLTITLKQPILANPTNSSTKSF